MKILKQHLNPSLIKTQSQNKRGNMICKICGTNETDNPDGICDDCKVSIISDDDICPNVERIVSFVNGGRKLIGKNCNNQKGN